MQLVLHERKATFLDVALAFQGTRRKPQVEAPYLLHTQKTQKPKGKNYVRRHQPPDWWNPLNLSLHAATAIFAKYVIHHFGERATMNGPKMSPPLILRILASLSTCHKQCSAAASFWKSSTFSFRGARRPPTGAQKRTIRFPLCAARAVYSWVTPKQLEYATSVSD